MKTEDSVRTAARTIELFAVFAAVRRPLTLSELSQRMQIPVSSCHALLRTLEGLGYIYFLNERKKIYPTKRLATVAEAISAHDAVLEHLSPILRRLVDQTGETAILGKRQGTHVIYLDVIEGTHTVRYAAVPGDKKPLHSSAVGKALLGCLSERNRIDELERLQLDWVTDRTITNVQALELDITTSRTRGYFVTRGENVPDVMAIATTCIESGEPYGVAIAGPTTRLERDFDRYVAILLEAIKLHSSETWIGPPALKQVSRRVSRTQS
jgi:IclR family acetate operon transcriptional repressor